MVEVFELGSGSSSADPEGALSGTPTLPKAQQLGAAIVRALAREAIRELCAPAIGGGGTPIPCSQSDGRCASRPSQPLLHTQSGTWRRCSGPRTVR